MKTVFNEYRNFHQTREDKMVSLDKKKYEILKIEITHVCRLDASADGLAVSCFAYA